jgi:23S rRNA (uridine2552-2'-O)-methyltransferase
MKYERKDSYYRRAKSAGYRSRAAYKLLELARRYRLIRRGDSVLDLGAWPGGWLQVAAELVGERGTIIGVDLVAIEPIGLPAISTLQGSVLDETVIEEIRRRSAGGVDVVLSDMAPKLTGVRDRDEARAAELLEAALTVARRLLRPGGRVLIKTFAGPDTQRVLAELRGSFQTVKVTRPEASRKGSAEAYLIALDHRRPSAPHA